MNNKSRISNTILDLKRVAVLGNEPVTLQEAKTQLIVTDSDNDAKITELITVARQHLENYCSISIVYQRIQLIAILVGEWKLPYGPVIGLESVEQAVNTTGSAPLYEAQTDNFGLSGDWFNPAASAFKQRITYTAGYTTCPYDLKQVILKVIAHLYDNRGQSIKEDDIKQIMKAADHYRVLLWA